MYQRFVGATVALVMVLAACTGQSATPGPSETGGESQAPTVPQVLRVNISQEPHYLDPNLASDSISIQVLRSITYPLEYFNPDLELVPGIATSVDVNADGTELTYNLGDFKYSNGDDIVAADFVYSYRRLADPRVASDYSYVLEPLVGWSELQDLGADATDADLETLGVAAPDDKTFVVTLKSPSSYFRYIGAMWLTVPIRSDFVFTEAEGYVASGPFMVTEWRHESNIVLEPNPFWAGTQNLARIEMAMINDGTAAMAAYEADELDVTGVPRAEVNRVREDPTLSAQLHEKPALSIAYFGFDLKNPDGLFTRSPLARKAFNEALNKDVMLATIFSGIGTVAYSAIPPGMPGHQDDQFIPYDVAQAQADFDQALSDLGIAKADLHLQLGYNVAGSNEDLAVFFQEQWREVFGIEVELVATGDFGAYLDALAVDPPDIFRLGWGADYPHPQNFLYDLFNKDSGNNYMGYNNPDFEALLAEARTKATLDEQIPIYNAAQELLMTDAPFIPQTFGALFALVKPWVQGLTQTAADTSSGSGEYFYNEISIADH